MITTIGRVRCPLCGARLREGRQIGEFCDPCERLGPDPRRALPADFYRHAPIVGMLATYDFGSFFAAVREVTGWTQQTLAGVVGLTQSHISSIERGEHRLRDIEAVASIARGLAIPPALLKFPDVRSTVGRQDAAEREEAGWVDRRDFGQHIAGLVLGIAGAAGLDTGRLLALLPQAEPAGTRHVGIADVEVIEQLTAGFRRQDFAYGSGVVRDAAVAQVNAVLPLLDAQVPDQLRPRLLLAAGELATQAGWMSFVVKDDEAARRLWMIALDLARNAEHPRSTDLTVYLLSDLALQAVHLKRPDEALHLARVGETATVGQYPVSASTISLMRRIQGEVYAARGDGKGCDRALGEAVEQFSVIDPAAAPPWTAYLAEAGISGGQGSAHYELARVSGDQLAAGRAVQLLRQAVDRYGPGYGRFRARYLPDLTGAHALAGDTDTAVTLGHQAIDAVTAVSAPQNYDRLRILNTVLEPLHASPGVAELRDRLATTAA